MLGHREDVCNHWIVANNIGKAIRIKCENLILDISSPGSINIAQYPAISDPVMI